MTSVSGIGSWPGEGVADVREALRRVRDLLGDDGGIPYLPEVPGRGPGADMIGRTAGLLVEMPVDLTSAGWRLVDRPGRDLTRAQAMLGTDLDELAEAFDGFTGPLKVQVAGPLTLAASVWLPRGEKIVSDAGATRELAESLAEGVASHLAHVRRLVPGAELVLQVDEPSLPAVLAGRIRTLSGYGRLLPLEGGVAERLLGTVVDAAGVPVVLHCCAPGLPWPLVQRAGVQGVAVDTSLLGPAAWESVAATVESGLTLWAGVTDAGDTRRPQEIARAVLEPWRRVGLEAERLGDLVLTPTCGLAGATPAQATAAHDRLLVVAEELQEALA